MDNKREVVFSRVVNAPRERVWKAWTDPAEITKWWGPNDVNIPECEVDLRVGGKIRIVMEAGEAMGQYKGTRWPMEGTFTAVEPIEKLAYAAKAWTEGAEEATEIDQLQEITLTDEGGKTKVDLKVTINKTGPGAGAAVQGMQYGFTQQFEKLEKYLVG